MHEYELCVYIGSMMMNPIGSVLQQTSGVVGKDNCVELMVPVQVWLTLAYTFRR